MFQEIEYIQPKKIITFGNQVSSIRLSKQISVSQYMDISKNLVLEQTYPVYYPVGHDRRNQPLTIERIRSIL